MELPTNEYSDPALDYWREVCDNLYTSIQTTLQVSGNSQAPNFTTPIPEILFVGIEKNENGYYLRANLQLKVQLGATDAIDTLPKYLAKGRS